MNYEYTKNISSAQSRPHHFLKDGELLNLTTRASLVEKEATFALLGYLVEIDIRKLYATKAYSSLFEYIVKELKLSEPAAAERVNAVRLMRAVPEVKDHLENGALTLTNAAQIQRFIRTEEKVKTASQSKVSTISEKTALVNACLGQSKREVERMLLAKHSNEAQILTQEKIKLVTPDRSEIRFTVEEKTIQKLNRVKELLGELSLELIFDQALDLLVLSEEKKQGFSRVKPAVKTNADSSVFADRSNSAVFTGQANSATQPAEFVKSEHSRYVSIALKRAIFARSTGQCEFINLKSKIRCSSKYRLQIDHIYPFAFGGKTELNNLRHLCPNHNQRAAIQWGFELH